MTTYSKPAVKPAWGETNTSPADMVEPSDADTQTGWPLSDVPPSRQRFNWVLNWCMNCLRYFMQRGMVDYDAAETYAIGARIIGDDGNLYKSLVNANINHTPSTSPTQWRRFGYTRTELATATYATTAGTANALTAAFTPAYTAYADGEIYRLKIANTNTTATTGNIDGLGVKPVLAETHAACIGGELTAGGYAELKYDVTLDSLIITRSTNSYRRSSTPPSADSSTRNATTAFFYNALALFGIGVTAQAGAATDLNTLVTGGIYAVTSGAANIPTANNGTLLVGVSSTGISQIFMRASATSANHLYFRSWGNSGGWTAWSEAAPVDSPTFTTSASGPTPSTGDRSTKLATTQMFANEFANSSTANGYTKLPNGVIIQWGSFSGAGSGTTTTVTFPLAFPNARWAVSAIGANANNVTTGVWRDSAAAPTTTTQFAFATNGSGNTVFWIAIGN